MKESRRISINDFPKGVKLVFLLAPLMGFILIRTSLNNDFYFLYPTGEYIINNGFPTTDFLSMHSSMSIIVQQWLTTVIFYLIYSHFGLAGMIALVYICYAVFCVLMFRLCMLVSKNYFVSCVCAFVCDITMAVMFMATRPQIFTYLIILAELYALEKFVITKSIKHLFILPVLSLLLINLHSSMWLMFFVFALPYGAAALPIKLGKIKQQPCCSFMTLAIFGIICFAVGFINPYGTKAMFYLFSSFGYSYINSLIAEMAPIAFNDAPGYLFFALLGVIAILAVCVKNTHFTTRFVLLFSGTLVLALMNFKSIAYFLIAGLVAVSYMLKDTELYFNITEGERTKKEKRKIVVLTVLIIALIISGIAVFIGQENNNSGNIDNTEKSGYEALDEISDILEKEEGEIILYTGFDWGPYMEFKGYHPYIDCRAELFLDDNNGEFNYMKEYCDLFSSEIYYKDFIEKYKFNYFIIDKGEKNFFISMLNDDDYEVLYNCETIYLFAPKK